MKYRCRCHPQSAFHWRDERYVQMICWQDANKAQVASERSTQVVNAKRATGMDVATIHGLSDRPQVRKLDPKHFHVFMKAIPSGKNKRTV